MMIFQLMTNKHTMFVRAKNAIEARSLAGAETENNIWKYAQQASCEAVDTDGESRVVAWFDDDKMNI